MRFLFIVLLFFFQHFIYISLGLTLYYSSNKYSVRSFAWRLVAMGLAPCFGVPKHLHNWVSIHCAYKPCDIRTGRCKYWTCSKYGECVYSLKNTKKGSEKNEK